MATDDQNDINPAEQTTAPEGQAEGKQGESPKAERRSALKDLFTRSGAESWVSRVTAKIKQQESNPEVAKDLSTSEDIESQLTTWEKITRHFSGKALEKMSIRLHGEYPDTAVKETADQLQSMATADLAEMEASAKSNQATLERATKRIDAEMPDISDEMEQSANEVKAAFDELTEYNEYMAKELVTPPSEPDVSDELETAANEAKAKLEEQEEYRADMTKLEKKKRVRKPVAKKAEKTVTEGPTGAEVLSAGFKDGPKYIQADIDAGNFEAAKKRLAMIGEDLTRYEKTLDTDKWREYQNQMSQLEKKISTAEEASLPEPDYLDNEKPAVAVNEAELPEPDYVENEVPAPAVEAGQYLTDSPAGTEAVFDPSNQPSATEAVVATVAAVETAKILKKEEVKLSPEQQANKEEVLRNSNEILRQIGEKVFFADNLRDWGIQNSKYVQFIKSLAPKLSVEKLKDDEDVRTIFKQIETLLDTSRRNILARNKNEPARKPANDNELASSVEQAVDAGTEKIPAGGFETVSDDSEGAIMEPGLATVSTIETQSKAVPNTAESISPISPENERTKKQFEEAKRRLEEYIKNGYFDFAEKALEPMSYQKEQAKIAGLDLDFNAEDYKKQIEEGKANSVAYQKEEQSRREKEQAAKTREAYNAALQEASLEYLLANDAKYFNERYSGKLSPSGYLLDKNGNETNDLPNQLITSGFEKVESAARAKLSAADKPITTPEVRPEVGASEDVVAGESAKATGYESSIDSTSTGIKAGTKERGEQRGRKPVKPRTRVPRRNANASGATTPTATTGTGGDFIV